MSALLMYHFLLKFQPSALLLKTELYQNKEVIPEREIKLKKRKLSMIQILLLESKSKSLFVAV